MTSQSTPAYCRNAATNAARFSLLTLLWMMLAAGLTGCATSQSLQAINAVRVCSGGECSASGERYSTPQLLHALDRLFQLNDGVGLTFCKSNPVTRQCMEDDLGYFVLGGIIPGRGSSSTGKVSQVKIDVANRSIRYVMSMDLRFLGLPLVCADHNAVLAVRSSNDIAITDSAYPCSWLVMGVMSASFSFVIDSVDFDKGQLGGYWKHSVYGTGNGRGHGYGLIKFSKGMPREEDWLDQQ